MLAAIVKTPELALSEGESEKLAMAAANVARHYDVRASEKVMDWANLAFAMGAIYGPRIAVMKMRKREEKKKEAPVAETVQPDMMYGMNYQHG